MYARRHTRAFNKIIVRPHLPTDFVYQMNRREPISIEVLLKKKKESQEASRKPKFLSKKERERLALEKLQQHAQENHHNTNTNNAKPIPAKPVKAQKNGSGRDDQINSRVPAPQKRRGVGKFNFEWKLSDDTLDQNDPLYNPRSQDAASLSISGGGVEERKRRQEELEQLRKKNKLDWDDVHWSKKPLDKMKERDWRIFKEDYSILTKTVAGTLPFPLRSWEESKIPPEILKTIKEIGYKEPTPIQRAAIPIALSLKDVIGIAETGSGKTASFVIPLLAYIMELPALNEVTKIDGPYGIILAPTRELAQQIETEAQKFCGPLGFRCASIVGGHSIEEQVYKLQEGAEIIIATPGRLVDCIERRILVLSQCCYVVMDEADRMIDLGFEESVNKILAALPVTNQKPENEENAQHEYLGFLQGREKIRQTMMFTATWPRAIERLAEQYLRSPGVVNIGNAGQAVDSVEQRAEFVSGEEKRKRRMIEILSSGEFVAPIIIFVNVKRNCDLVARALITGGWRSAVMHGSKSQEQRELALSQLRNGQVDCLVATDIAGRGIDVSNVSLVLNFQMCRTIEDYTHRIGRTGRAGKNGVAITFLGKEDDEVLYDLKQMISRSPISKLSEELRRHEAAQTRPLPKKLQPPQDEEQ